MKQKCFGETLSYVYAIEFQQRGLPHMHLLVTLKYNCKISTPDAVNRYISYEELAKSAIFSAKNVVFEEINKLGLYT